MGTRIGASAVGFTIAINAVSGVFCFFDHSWLERLRGTLYAVSVQRAFAVDAWVSAVLVGPYLSVASAWTVADIGNGCMMFPNLVALLSLSGVLAHETREYFAKHGKKSYKNGKKSLDGREKG